MNSSDILQVQLILICNIPTHLIKAWNQESWVLTCKVMFWNIEIQLK